MKRTRSIFATTMTLGLALALQSGCAGTAKVADVPAAPPVQPTTAPPQVETLSGKVVEVMHAGGYTYVRLEKDGKSGWAAMTRNDTTAVGEEVALRPGMVMTNFKSAALNRTFERIVFTDGRADTAAKAPHTQSQALTNELSGKVVETMDAGGYTYVNLARDGKNVWVALPVTKVKVGDELAALPGMRMDKFTSKSLNRTFDVIYFSSGVAGNGAAPAPEESVLPPGHPK
ncbi:hypothetical protein E4633_18670 [Geomonas terrae]|uniref:Lipoprotein n=1 Tax=Geomonas terrae TaxID=2562681 RepID=A0A4S1CA98_9BACT|nr:hypothetical protein [Geomonas terrae]TGU70224.1 hypothetical protein E4633_18670 [Geomonas terrae]